MLFFSNIPSVHICLHVHFQASFLLKKLLAFQQGIKIRTIWAEIHNLFFGSAVTMPCTGCTYAGIPTSSLHGSQTLFQCKDMICCASLHIGRCECQKHLSCIDLQDCKTTKHGKEVKCKNFIFLSSLLITLGTLFLLYFQAN